MAFFSYDSEQAAPVINKSYSHLVWAYKRCDVNLQNRTSVTTSPNTFFNKKYETTTTIQAVTKYKLANIRTALCLISFYRDKSVRRDVLGEKALDRIIMHDLSNNVLKSIYFNYSYFGPSSSTNPEDVRLRLDRISIKGSGCLTTSTSFLYHEYGPSVSRYATNKDYWGYFNGNTNGELLPYVVNEGRYPYGDRVPSSSNAAQNCLLYKIQLATGAFTELSFGAHIDGTGARIGGVRLEQVRVHDGVQTTKDQIFKVKYNTFDPINNTFTSSSSAPTVSIPQFHDWQNYRYPVAYTDYATSGLAINQTNLCLCNTGDDLIDQFLYRSSEPLEPIAPDYIHYQWVALEQPNHSHSVYRFSSSQGYPDNYNSQSVKVTSDPFLSCPSPGDNRPHERAPNNCSTGNCIGDPMAPRNAGNYLTLPQAERPFGIRNSAANKRGYLLRNIELDSDRRTISETNNTYEFNTYDMTPLRSAAYDRERYVFGFPSFNYYYNFKVYKIERDWVPLIHQTVTRYDQRRGNSNAIISKTQSVEYTYRNNFVWQVKTIQYGDVNTYVVEYTRVKDGNAPAELINAKSFATVLQKEQYRLDANNVKQGSLLTHYEFKPNGNNYVWPLRVGTIDASTGSTQRQYQIQAVELNSYGNAVNVQSVTGLWSSNLLGHDYQLPIAAVTNGKFSNGTLAASAGHTSFEDDGNPDQWSVAMDYSAEAKTGKRSVRLTAQYAYGPQKLFVLSPAQQKGKYKFTCWTKLPTGANSANLVVVVGLQDANGAWLKSSANNSDAWYGVGYTVSDRQKWRLCTATVDFDDPAVQATIPAGQDVRVFCSTWMPWGTEPVLVDEARFQSENARMITTTYQPMVGKTSETNENNVTTYYLYDAENQLWMVKDADGNILKRIKTNSIAASREIEASVARTSGNAYPNTSVTFTAIAEACDANITYSWNFGDPGSVGNTITGINEQSHTYAVAGTYLLTVVATAPSMNPVEKTLSISVVTPLEVLPSYVGNTEVDLCNSPPDQEASIIAHPQGGCVPYRFQWESSLFNVSTSSWGPWTIEPNITDTYTYKHQTRRQIQVRCTVTDGCNNTAEFTDGFVTYRNVPDCGNIMQGPTDKSAK